MNIAIIGTGYVGLTTGVCLAWLRHDVTCIDTDTNKIAMLDRGESPIYEPFLAELMSEARPRLRFTTSYADPIAAADVVFIAVGTPSCPDGRPDLQYLASAAEAIGEHLSSRFTVVVNKSTVPIGSGNWVESLIADAYVRTHGRKPNGHYAIASNPEFLREGSAIQDTLFPDRIVVGSDNPHAIEVLYTLYRPILDQTFSAPAFLSRPEAVGAVPLVSADLASAELIKYAANAFLAMKISYINEIGLLAERVGADVRHVAKGIGLDSRIGSRFLQAGIGWGGSCFAKDTAALIATAAEYGLEMRIVQAARDVNRRQREIVVDRLLAELKILKGRTVGLLGLSFKPNTDDLRDAPAVDIVQSLLKRGCRVNVHDPVALDRFAREHYTLPIVRCRTAESVADDADAIVLVTEWPQYRDLDWARVLKTMRTPLLVDGRNHLDRARMEALGFRYLSIPALDASRIHGGRVSSAAA
jgi:UDPglucose 6-dehydrogenase